MVTLKKFLPMLFNCNFNYGCKCKICLTLFVPYFISTIKPHSQQSLGSPFDRFRCSSNCWTLIGQGRSSPQAIAPGIVFHVIARGNDWQPAAEFEEALFLAVDICCTAKLKNRSQVVKYTRYIQSGIYPTLHICNRSSSNIVFYRHPSQK